MPTMLELLDSTRQCFARALRSAFKTPRFVLVGSMTLGIAIGALSVVFSWIDAFVLTSLPYPSPAALYAISVEGEDGPIGALTPEEYRAIDEAELGAAFSSVRRVALIDGHTTAMLSALRVDAGFSRTLGLPLALGRAFLDTEDAPGPTQAAILSYATWTEHFAASREVIGKRVMVDGQWITIVGVLAEAVRWHERFDLLLPLGLERHSTDRGRNLVVIARAPADSDSAALLARIRTHLDRLPASEMAPTQKLLYTLVPLSELLAGSSKRQLRLFLVGAFCALLVAVFNLANLFVQRLAARRSDLAIQRALGAPNSRLVGEVLAESSLLAFAATLVGGVLAAVILQQSRPWLPEGWGFAVPQFGFRSFIFALVISTAASAACALLALWKTLSRNPASDIVAGGQLGPSRGASRLGGALILGQTAIAMALLCLSIQMVDSVRALNAVDLGFRSNGVVRFSLSPVASEYPDGKSVRAMLLALAQELRGMPGADTVTIAPAFPIGDGLNLPMRIGTRESADSIEVRFVAGDYFSTYSIPVLQGRPLRASDDETGEPVVVVSQTLANALPSDVRLGGVMRFSLDGIPDLAGMNNPEMRVVGVVGDTRQFGPQAPPVPTIFLPLAQTDPQLLQLVRTFRPWRVGVKMRGGEGGLLGALRAATAHALPLQPIDELGILQEDVDAATRDQRLYLWLAASLAVTALCLVLSGLYSILGADLAQRQREFGLRLAMGAAPWQLAQVVLRRMATLVSLGAAAGVALALFAGRVLEHQLDGLSSPRFSSLAAVVVVFMLLALLASMEAAWRAARTDPAECLRQL